MAESKSRKSRPKQGIWVTVTDPKTGKKKSKRLPDGAGITWGRGPDGRFRQSILPPQPIRELPPRKQTVKRKAG
jgi:hypothetical protein